MRLLHATSVRKSYTIHTQGLKAGKSKGAAKTVWLVSEGNFAAAVNHAMKRHNLKPDEVIVFEVDVPRSWVRKGRRKGLWHTGGRDVPNERISGILKIMR